MATSGQMPPTDRGFNYVFLIELLVCGALSIFFLFYFNRLFAWLISHAIQAYSWHVYKAHIDITALQFSPLGGRVFFKTLRYRAHNETILIHDGRITWRYWLRKVQDADIYRTLDRRKARLSSAGSGSGEKKHGTPDNETGHFKPEAALPCRIHVRVSGVEAFLYNHSPSYDHILSEVEAAKRRQTSSGFRQAKTDGVSPTTETASGSGDGIAFDKVDGDPHPSIESSPTRTTSSSDERSVTSNVPSYLNLFPIQVECRKAAAAIGNENTTSVIVAKADHADGRIDAGQAGPLDIFKLLFLFDIKNVSVSMHPNKDFKETQTQAASGAKRIPDAPSRNKFASAIFSNRFVIFIKQLRSRIWTARDDDSVRTMSTTREKSQPVPQRAEASRHVWHGLSRFMDEHDHAQNDEWDNVEYAKVSSLAEFKGMSLKFYWDVAGPISESDQQDPALPQYSSSEQYINGAAAPEYGLELVVRDGVVNYGPSADRERVGLQAMFFPASLITAAPFPALKYGQTRLSTMFSMSFFVEGTVTLRIPTREASKDWKWRSLAARTHEQKPKSGLRRRGFSTSSRPRASEKQHVDSSAKDKRPFGWLDVTVQQDTSVHYDMDMYARSSGFHNQLRVEAKSPQISTSVNHDVLWRSGDIVVKGDLSNPLSWNALRTWRFDIQCRDLELFILRDHMFLLTDLITDWASGNPPAFHTFVPFKYELQALFINYKLLLNANDANLINRPTDMDDNHFLVLGGERLDVDFSIPLEHFRSPKNTFTFDVTARHIVLDMMHPPKSTLHELLEDKRLGHVPDLTLTGCYTGNADQSPALTDVLQMEIIGKGATLTVSGYLLRYFVNFKNNYFGEYLHFRTFEEYHETGGDTAQAIKEEIERHRYRKSNDLDVLLSIVVDKPCLKVPSNLYSARQYVQAEVPTANVDLRVSNYYLDLQVDVDPISITCSDEASKSAEETLDEQLRIEAVTVNGHRLFGLPPDEPAYVSTFDVASGDITGKCTTQFLHLLLNAGQAFAFDFANHENGFPHAAAVEIDDMIFLQVRTGSLALETSVADASFIIGFDPIDLRFDDFANDETSARLSTCVPNLTICCLQQSPMSESDRHGIEEAPECTLFLQTTVDFQLLLRNRDAVQSALKQQMHLQLHDIRGKRATFLYRADLDRSSLSSYDLPIDKPAMYLPALPKKLVRDHHIKRFLSPVVRASQFSTKSPFAVPAELSIGREPLSSPYLRKLHFHAIDPSIFDDLPPYVLMDNGEHDTYDGAESNAYVDGTGQANLSDEASTTLLVKFVPGIRAFVRPSVVTALMGLLSALTASDADDVMDKIQLSIIGKVESLLQAQVHSSCVDLSVLAPSIAARVLLKAGSQKHKLDATLLGLATSLRLRNRVIDETSTSNTVLHTVVKSAALEFFAHGTEGSPTHADVNFEVEDILTWLILADEITANGTSRVVSLRTETHRMKELALATLDVTHEAIILQKKIEHFSFEPYQKAIKLLKLVSEHQNAVTDPLHLSRMTYIVRAYPLHLRNQGSWKMLARIRHVFRYLQAEHRAELANVLGTPENSPGEDHYRLEALLGWCSFDVPAAQDSCMYQYFSAQRNGSTDPTNRKALQLTVRLGLLRLLFGSDNHESEVSVADLGIDVSVEPPSEPKGLMLVEANIRTLLKIASSSSAIFVRLKWDLISALHQTLDVLGARSRTKASTTQRPKLRRIGTIENFATRDDFHFVFVTDDVSTIIESVNLQHLVAVQNLQVSLIRTSRKDGNYGSAMTSLASCDEATTELSCRGWSTQRIWRTVLTQPGLYLDYRERLKPRGTEVNVGGTYKSMSVMIDQEPIGLLRVIDKVLVSEVTEIKDLEAVIRDMFGKATPQEAHTEPTTMSTKIEINAGLLAGPFDVSFAVLKSLSINVRGKLANLRIRPRQKDESPYILETDLGPIRFAAISQESRLAGETALFHTPSIGTSAELLLSEQERSLKLSSSIEEMKVEAQALQNILAVIKRPQVQSAIDALEDGISDIERRVGEVFGPSKSPIFPRDSTPQPPLRYNINVASAGVRIVAYAPVNGKSVDNAELAIGIGKVQVVIDNGYQSATKAQRIPEIFASIDSIYANLDLTGPDLRKPCGHVQVALLLRSTLPPDQSDSAVGDVTVSSDNLDIEISADTASTVVDIITNIQKKIYDLDLTKEMDYIKRFHSKRGGKHDGKHHALPGATMDHLTIEHIAELAPSNLVISLSHIRFAWIVATSPAVEASWQPEDLELTLARVELSVRQRNRAQLTIESLQLQMVPQTLQSGQRSLNSGLLPEMIFLVRFHHRDGGVHLAFQAVGQSADFQFDSGFVKPLNFLIESGTTALKNYREASKNWLISRSSEAQSESRGNPFGARQLLSLLVDVNFAGGLLHLRGSPLESSQTERNTTPLPRVRGRGVETTLRSPGVAMKLEYRADENRLIESTLTSEIKVNASSNTVYPELVPIVLQITEQFQAAMQDSGVSKDEDVASAPMPSSAKTATMTLPNEDLLMTNKLLARTKISVGLRILKQEFGLSCQPIAKVNAKALIDDIYVSIDTLDPPEGARFLTVAAVLTGFKASVQHLYSRDSTFSFDIESVNLSVMNSRHAGEASAGVTAVLKIEPMKTSINARQLQDLLLFREIWLPEQIRKSEGPESASRPTQATDDFLVQRYRQVSDAAAFPWTAAITLTQVALDIDFGQSIGRSSIEIQNLWILSSKTSDWKQELCLGVDAVIGRSVGRMGGAIVLDGVEVRTLIEWPMQENGKARTPLVQATLGFKTLKVKAAFDYQPFAFADLGSLSFIMFNVRDAETPDQDRLVVTLDIGNAYAYMTATSPAQALALYQAFDRLIQEKQAAFRQSVNDIQRHLHRPSMVAAYPSQTLKPLAQPTKKVKIGTPIRLRSDVLVRVSTINVGVYPSTFFDGQVLKLEAIDGQARFVVDITSDSRIHSNLGLVLGQLQVSLAATRKMQVPKSLSDVSVEEVVENGVAAKGGVILRVPRLVATMQTWQLPRAKVVEYIFKSTFEGKIDVGWNYSRISFIRTMWNTHTRSLATRLGKPLPEPAVRITTGPDKQTKETSRDGEASAAKGEETGKITAVISMPMSRYDYIALEPSIIETPQLRDMGDATPPLEWIGLQRDRLPNVVHQVVIVALLELAQEVEEAYGRILGAS